MKIVHRIAWGRSEARLTQAMQDAGVEIDLGDHVHVAIVSEDDPKWPAVAQIADGGIHLTWTTFTEQELEQCDYVVLRSNWHNGYPEPSDDFGYLERTYDLSNYCEACGAGARQKAPFRLHKPPKWGRRGIFELNWVFEEHFVRPDLWETVFKPLGIGCREVVLNKSGATIDTVVQLDVQQVVELDMNDPRLNVTVDGCNRCKRPRYHYTERGYEPRPVRPPGAHAFKSAQYFGAGHQSNRLTYVSRELFKKLAGLRGIEFKACVRAFPRIPSPVPDVTE
jgi:hypothetical protein